MVYESRCLCESENFKMRDVRKSNKSLWEKKNLEGVGKVLLIEESYYDWIAECVKKQIRSK